MSVRTLTTLLALAIGGAGPLAGVADAQILRGIGRTAKTAAESEAKREIDDLVRKGVRCVFDDFDCIRRAKESGRTPVMTDDQGNLLTDKDGRPITDPAQAAAQAEAKPGTGAWANYDFVPGDRVVFADDFTADRIGDFPRRLELIAGNWEVVEWQGARYLRATANGAVGIPLPETLPEQFTVELTASVTHGNAYLRLTTGPLNHGKRDYAGSVPSLEYSQAGLRSAKNQGPMIVTNRRATTREQREALVNLRLMADGGHMKMYLDEHRVANAPNAVFPRTKTLFLTVSSASEKTPVLIGPVRIAAGGLDLYDALEKHGRVATQGIYFATNSDRIRPESTPTLQEIGEMLKAHPALRLSIEGHTDSDGEDAYNQQLSERRAAAVRGYLVETFSIDAGRLETAGHGESKPVADNSTPEGKQQNRRVELVKLDGGRP